jgi:hypothetical protein
MLTFVKRSIKHMLQAAVRGPQPVADESGSYIDWAFTLVLICQSGYMKLQSPTCQPTLLMHIYIDRESLGGIEMSEERS